MNEREVEGFEKKGEERGRQFGGGVIQRMRGTALPPSLPLHSSGWKFILQAEQRTFVWRTSTSTGHTYPRWLRGPTAAARFTGVAAALVAPQGFKL